ncbi:MAG: hypothetical protein IJJ94_01075 [Bacteroidaceae bacterium]|nr:hypothetical protein [Bacteroidaceae bacterium]
MPEPLLLDVHLDALLTADDLSAALRAALGAGCAPRTSTLNAIRARARAVRPL